MTNRRDFLKKSISAAALSVIPSFYAFAEAKNKKNETETGKVLPERLKKGDTIGLIAPGGNITEGELEDSVKNMQNLGFKTYYTQNINAQDGYLAGSDEQRASDIMHMFENKNIDGIVCVRGGYGTIRTLDLLDYELICQNPKVVMGYSDITALVNAIYQKTALVTFHGPVGSSTFNEFSTKSFKKVVMKSKERYKYKYEREADSDENPEFDTFTITPGKASGELIGGNLVMLTTMIGTKYEPDFKNKIIFMEEISEKPYKIDRMITHLLMATNFSKAAGIVCGIFNKCDVSGKTEKSLSLKDVLVKRLRPLNIPAYYGASFGHVANKLTLPVGVEAKLNANKLSLKLLEKSVK